MFCCDRCSLVQLSLWEYLGKKEKGERHITTLKMAIIMTFTCCVSHHVLQSPFSSSPPLLSLCLSTPPLLHFNAWTPTEWKTSGSGTAQSTLCPILQWIPIYLSPFLLCPVCSLAPCPHLRWGRAAETKEKQPVWEHVSHPHMVLSPSPPFCEFVSQPYSLVVLWCYG